MSAPVPVSTLTTFSEKGLRAVYTSTTQVAFGNAFEAFFSRHVDVTLNGKTISREQFKKELWDEKNKERRGTVTFLGAVEADNKSTLPVNDGIVGLFLNAVLSLAKEGIPFAEETRASYRLTIAEDRSAQPTYPVGPAERRRVSIVDVVTTSETIW